MLFKLLTFNIIFIILKLFGFRHHPGNYMIRRNDDGVSRKA